MLILKQLFIWLCENSLGALLLALLLVVFSRNDQSAYGRTLLLGRQEDHRVHPTINNPVPALSSVLPNPIDPGSQLTVSGSNFVPSSSIEIDGNAIPTVFSSNSQVVAITPRSLAAGVSHAVSVSNPSPGGGLSSTQSLTANARVSVIPTQATVQPSTFLDVFADANSAVTWTQREPSGFIQSPNGALDSLTGLITNFYNVPTVAGVYHIDVCSTVTTTACGTITVTVNATAGAFKVVGGTADTHDNKYTVTALANDQVLIAGGDFGKGVNELYDPGTGTTTPVPPMITPRQQHGATLLLNGQVLVCGGEDATQNLLSSCELYDPPSNSWLPGPNMSTVRRNHRQVRLLNGDVLIVGGSQFVPRSAEIYKAATNSFAPAGDMVAWRFAGSATLLAGGKVLVAGGFDPTPAVASFLKTAEVYDPATNGFSSTANAMTLARFGQYAVSLPDGRAVIAGTDSQVDTSAAIEIYDPTTNQFTVAGTMQMERPGAAIAVLPNGKVLLAGGDFGLEGLKTAEIFDPGTGVSSFTSEMSTFRTFPFTTAVTTLSDGRIVVVGSILQPTAANPVEIYTAAP